MTKKTLVLNDDPLMHLALGMVLDAIPNVQHLANAKELSAALDANVACVIVDCGMPGLDLPKIAAAVAEKSPRAGLVVLGKTAALPGFPEKQLMFTEELHSQREKIGAWIAAYSKS
jgi:DNA-binding NarL/FixJ family response regulator